MFNYTLRHYIHVFLYIYLYIYIFINYRSEIRGTYRTSIFQGMFRNSRSLIAYHYFETRCCQKYSTYSQRSKRNILYSVSFFISTGLINFSRLRFASATLILNGIFKKYSLTTYRSTHRKLKQFRFSRKINGAKCYRFLLSTYRYYVLIR